MTNSELKALLQRFLQKAWCFYTESAATSLWRRISKHIPTPYRESISIEWSHVQMGHGKEQALMALKHEVEKFINEKLV